MQRKPLDAEMELFRNSARKFFQTEIRPHSERWREAGIRSRFTASKSRLELRSACG